MIQIEIWPLSTPLLRTVISIRYIEAESRALLTTESSLHWVISLPISQIWARLLTGKGSSDIPSFFSAPDFYPYCK